ncbi:WD40 repeat domain-containing protein [Polymorphospora rubra]|uniref:WD40 repeat domain-containing protein n=1 Tax=Polymorphospora rubra TaxID=338584 RepID=UPI003403E564
MDRFERMLTLLRRGQTEHAEQLRAESPAAWLPQWTAGEPLSRALRQAHQLGSLITAVHVDDTFAWALAGGTVFRTSLTDGVVHRLALEGRDKFHWDAAFAGDTVVAVDDGRLLVWDLTTGKMLLATDPDDVPRRAGGLRRLAVGAGVAVTGTEGGYLLQWDLATGRLLARTAAHGGYVVRVAISADGTPAVLSLGGEDRWTGTVCFHNLDGLRRTGEVATPEEASCGGWTVLDGQRRAVTVTESGLLTVWDPATAVPVAQFSTAVRQRGTLAFAAGGAWAVLGESRALRIVDLRDGVVRGTIRTDFTFDVDKIAACGRFVFAAQGGSTEGRTNLLELTDPPTQDAEDRPRLLDAVPATVGGRAVVVAVDEDGPYRVYDSADGRELGSVGERTNKHRSVGGRPRLRTVSVGGRDLVLSMSDLVPTVVDPATDEIRTASRPSMAGPVLSAAATRDGLVAMVDAGGTLAVWDGATLTLRASTRIARSLETTSVALGDLHGRTVVLTGAVDGGIRWFDGADLTELPPPGRFAERTGLAGHAVNPMRWPGPDAVTALHVAGAVVVSAVGGTVTCADIATGEPSGPALAHPGKVWAVLPAVRDGVPVVATSCADRVLRIWDIATGRIIRAVTLPRPIYRILSVTTEQIIVLDSGYLIAVGPGARLPVHHEAVSRDGTR